MEFSSYESLSGPRKFNLRKRISAVEATFEVSQNMENFVKSLYIQEVDASQSYLCRV